MNKEQSHINDDLLVKQLLGETTATEQAAVSAWINKSETNRKHYEQLQRIWDNSKQLAAESTIDENEAWERFQQKIANKEQDNGKTIHVGRRMSWMRVAAMLVILLGAGWFLYHNYTSATTTYIAQGTVVIETLPDGTMVTLNKGASIEFNSRFNGNTRNVTLEGEAFFDVAPNKQKPFVISTDNAKIKVVGTSFNVKSSAKETEVIVETGIVEVSKKKNSIKVLPKEKAIVLQNEAKPIKSEVEDVLYNYYRTKELVCKNTPLWRLVDVLNEAYDTHIIIADPQLKDLPITTTFKNSSLDDVLTIIAGTLHVRIEKNGKNILIK